MVLTSAVGAAIVMCGLSVATPAAAQAPTVTANPQNQIVAVGATASFNAAAVGAPSPSVQWQVSTDGGTSYVNIAGATATSYTTPATIAADNGKRFRAAFANAGGTANSNAASLTVVLPPTANGQNVSTNYRTARAITLTGSDPNTPPRTLTYTVTSAPANGTLTGTAPNLTYMPNNGFVGQDSFTFTVSNGVSNSAPATVNITVNKASTVLYLTTTSGSPAPYGQPVRLDAAISGGTSTLTGTVTFQDNGSPIATVNVNGNAATFTANGLSVGSHTFTATYNGDANNDVSPRANSIGLSVQPAETTTSLSSTPNPSTLGQSVALTATVTSAGGTPSGTVNFQNSGGTIIGSGVLDSSGVARASVSNLPVGTSTLTARYLGSNNFNGSSGQLIQNVVAPTITVAPATVPNATVGTPYSVTVAANGGTAPYAFTATGNVPTGLSLSGDTLSGTPTAGGSFTFTINATDADGFIGSRTYTMTVGAAAITLAPATLPNGTSGIAYSQTITASGGTAPYSYVLAAGVLPAGLTLASNGSIAGTPRQSGSFTFSIRATDSSTGAGPYSGSQSYTVAISAPTVALAPATLPNATVAVAYSQTLTASGGIAPYSYAVTAGALPAGITLSAGGVLSGTPTAGGSFTFTATATDSTTAGNGGPFTASRSYTLTVANPTIAVAPATLPNGTSGVAYSQTLTASGGTAPYSYAVTAGALPAGLTLSSSGALSGTPRQSGNFNLSVTATDASTGTGPYSGTRSYTLAIAAAAPTVTSIAPASGTTLGGTNVTITGTDFTGATSVTIGGNAATNVVVTSATTITATTPAGTAGAASVLVTTPGGINTANAFYTYVTPAPAVTSVAPNNGSPLGGTAITITGANFTNASAVTIGGTPATAFTVTSATTINTTTPAHTPGTVDVAVTTPGGTGTGAGLYTYTAATTTTALMSSRNPSEAGQAVTFTATVASSTGATATGTVTFLANGTPIGTATLAGGVATITTAGLERGSTTITATFNGSTGFAGSTSAALIQVVTTPGDSLKLRSMQVLAAPVAAQASGQAISGAIDSAIAEGFFGGAALMAPSGSGIRFNFAGDSDADTASLSLNAKDPLLTANSSRVAGIQQPSRVDDAFSAMAYAMPTKAPPLLRRIAEPRDWLAWAEIRGATLDRWNGSAAAPSSTPTLYGNQVNLLAGLTRRITPNVLVGVVGGYETFDYRSEALQGRLKGDGWTVGAYLGLRLAPTLRYDAAIAYSGIGYDGTAGTASGAFGGQRWLFSTGFTGTYAAYGVQIEPSAKVYALWENENAYVDSLGTTQAQRRFATGRASGGVKLAYPIAWSQSVLLAPYVGLYSDYYFNSDSAALLATSNPAAIVLDGWSARAAVGLAANFGNGATIAFGGELGGIGNTSRLMTYRARASVPFSAQ